MLRRQVRLSKQDDLHRLRRLLVNLLDLRGGMAVARADSAQVTAGHAI